MSLTKVNYTNGPRTPPPLFLTQFIYVKRQRRPESESESESDSETRAHIHIHTPYQSNGKKEPLLKPQPESPNSADIITFLIN